MNEVDFMRDAGIAIVLAYVLLKLVNFLIGFATGNQASEKALTAIIDKLLTSMVDRFGELMLKVQTNNETLVRQMVESQARSNTEMVRQVSEHMAPTVARRDQKVDLIHADVKTVPAETQRLLQLDLAAQTENIRLAIETTLTETERRIIENLSQAGEAQKAVSIALELMKTDLALALEQLENIHMTLQRFVLHSDTEPGEHDNAPAAPVPGEAPAGAEGSAAGGNAV